MKELSLDLTQASMQAASLTYQPSWISSLLPMRTYAPSWIS